MVESLLASQTDLKSIMLEFSSIFYNDFFQIWEIKMPSNLTALQIQLEILRLIPKTRFITAEEILQKLADIGVQRDIRSIQRQLESLSQQFEIERVYLEEIV